MCGALSQVTGTGLHFSEKQKSSVNVFQIKQEHFLSPRNKNQMAKTMKFAKTKFTFGLKENGSSSS